MRLNGRPTFWFNCYYCCLSNKMMKQKRERSVNFTQEETDLLVSLVKAKKEIIESKQSDSAIWKEKEKAWKDIETVFNASSGSAYRSHKHLKLKYEAMKKDIRKKRADCYGNGDGTSIAPVLTRAERKVERIIRLSIDGNDSSSSCDSNVVLPCVVGELKEEKPMDELIEEKFGIAKLQKQILVEELEQKLLQRKILEQELMHKDVMHQLEQQHLLLKIELLKKNLGQ